MEVNAETLGLDVIAEVGPGGSFIDHAHTADHFRRELWFPKLLDRQYCQAWRDGGGLGMEERCGSRKEEILAEHKPEPLHPDIDRALDEIVEAAARG